MKKFLTKLEQVIVFHPRFFVACVLLICAAMRLYRIEELFPFSMDEEYQAYLSANMIRTGHIPLIGVNVADTGLYLGPLFTWLSALLYWIGNGNPIITAYAAVLVAVITCWLVIKIVTYITRDQWLGTIGGLLYGINPLLVMYDHKFWNPSLVMCLTALWLYSILRSAKDERWWWLVAFVFGMAFHSHYSLFILIIPTIYEFVVQVRTKVKRKHIFCTGIAKRFILVILICTAPLILFELRHDFIQMQAFTRYLSSSSSSQELSSRFWIMHAALNRVFWLGFDKDMVYELSLASRVRSTLILPVSAITIGLLWLALTHKQTIRFGKIALLTLGTYLSSVILFKSTIREYYLLPLFPMIIILIMVTAYVLIQRYGQKSEYVIGLVLIICGAVWTAQAFSVRNSLGIGSKLQAIETMQTIIKDKPYRLDAKGDWAYEGYRYLASWKGIEPAQSYMDGHFSWLYGTSTVEPYYH
jgi:4-amino-4-deoxy-L-arabinose transferase-like glycosyltransferase